MIQISYFYKVRLNIRFIYLGLRYVTVEADVVFFEVGESIQLIFPLRFRFLSSICQFETDARQTDDPDFSLFG